MILVWIVPIVLLFLLFRHFSGDRGTRRASRLWKFCRNAMPLARSIAKNI